MLMSFAVMAQEAEDEATEAHSTDDGGGANSGLIALGIGLGLGIAAAGGGMGQGRATAAALEGLSRNPGSYDKVFTPFILGMVLIESLVIYSLVISLLLLGKI
jgi:F-type H+-transporting ATPase subunit c